MNGEGNETMDSQMPRVRTGNSGNLGLVAFIAALLLGGVWLFSAIYTGDDAPGGIAGQVSGDPTTRISSPPPLVLPGAPQPLPLAETAPAPAPAPAAPQPFFYPAPPGPPPPVQQPAYNPDPVVTNPPPYAPPRSEVLFDPPARAQPAEDTAGNRVSAARIANTAYTVTQGTIIPAVLETAFDSTRPGRVRALVQRDVRGFDGTRILVPRGSRLFGEYEAGINPGERRAMIRWTRLLRPDGVSIALDSPATDPLGRGGVAGDVNSRFFARLGDALLQTVLGVGVGVASSEAIGGGVILSLPTTAQTAMPTTTSSNNRPVLRIDHGTSVSVYVARDLDFSTVDG
ncbi:MAG: TrbI/VirB10 family protein [Erythrobacter sp.]|nr:TrbI/VirB10 family protein [Erythrobacter sp.]